MGTQCGFTYLNGGQVRLGSGNGMHRRFVSARRRGRGYVVSPCMTFLEPVHSLPEFLNQLVVSCGIGLAGIMGAKATERARALTAGDRKAEYMDALAQEIDSLRRREQLKRVSDGRDWTDVGVDRFANVVVVPEVVPQLQSSDELEAFDRLLGEMDAEKGASLLPQASEFESLDDDDNNDDDGVNVGKGL